MMTANCAPVSPVQSDSTAILLQSLSIIANGCLRLPTACVECVRVAARLHLPDTTPSFGSV